MPVALITGAAGGVGQALCRVFMEHGYYVIGTDRLNQACLCDTFIHCDVQKLCHSYEYRGIIFSKIRAILGDQRLEVLINNAAVQLLNRTEEITVEEWHETLDVNLVAPFLLAQGLLPELEHTSGSVINIASVHATATKPGFVCYATSKAALVGMTRALAVDLGPKVRVNAVCPAATDTPMLRAGFHGKDELFKDLAKMHPMNRIAQPEEVALSALFLASRSAGFITGTVLSVDGGISGRLHDVE